MSAEDSFLGSQIETFLLCFLVAEKVRFSCGHIYKVASPTDKDTPSLDSLASLVKVLKPTFLHPCLSDHKPWGSFSSGKLLSPVP